MESQVVSYEVPKVEMRTETRQVRCFREKLIWHCSLKSVLWRLGFQGGMCLRRGLLHRWAVYIEFII